MPDWLIAAALILATIVIVAELELRIRAREDNERQNPL